MKKTSMTFIRPKDKSYTEYVNSIKAMCMHLGVPFNMTEGKLRAGYRKFLANSRKQVVDHKSAKPTPLKRVERG